MNPEINEVIEMLEELQDDHTVPRNVKEKVKGTINSLKENNDVKLNVNKALSELDEIGDDPNLQAFTRTQIWNIVSILEKFT